MKLVFNVKDGVEGLIEVVKKFEEKLKELAERYQKTNSIASFANLIYALREVRESADGYELWFGANINGWPACIVVHKVGIWYIKAIDLLACEEYGRGIRDTLAESAIEVITNLWSVRAKKSMDSLKSIVMSAEHDQFVMKYYR
jgi:hypothetical protein